MAKQPKTHILKCIKQNCTRRRHGTLTHCAECWQNVQRKRRKRQGLPATPPKPRVVGMAPPERTPLKGRAFLDLCRSVRDEANLGIETSHKANTWRLGKSPASR